MKTVSQAERLRRSCTALVTFFFFLITKNNKTWHFKSKPCAKHPQAAGRDTFKSSSSYFQRLSWSPLRKSSLSSTSSLSYEGALCKFPLQMQIVLFSFKRQSAFDYDLCVCICVCDRERERERELVKTHPAN